MANDIQQIDLSVNVLQAVLWQYDQSPNLLQLLNDKQAWYDKYQTQFWRDFMTNTFDLRTANDFGLTVWSIILGRPVYINNGPSALDRPAWGFEQYHKHFDQGNFASNEGNSFRLGTESARAMLQLRYFQLTSAGCIPELNRMLAFVFKDYGTAYVVDNLDMSIEYVFNFEVSNELQYLFRYFDILPRPAGVSSTYSIDV